MKLLGKTNESDHVPSVILIATKHEWKYLQKMMRTRGLLDIGYTRAIDSLDVDIEEDLERASRVMAVLEDLYIRDTESDVVVETAVDSARGKVEDTAVGFSRKGVFMGLDIIPEVLAAANAAVELEGRMFIDRGQRDLNETDRQLTILELFGYITTYYYNGDGRWFIRAFNPKPPGLPPLKSLAVRGQEAAGS